MRARPLPRRRSGGVPSVPILATWPPRRPGWFCVGLSPGDRERVQRLSGKASEGLLTPEESAELDSYLTVGSAREFLKAKARLSLRRASGDP